MRCRYFHEPCGTSVSAQTDFPRAPRKDIRPDSSNAKTFQSIASAQPRRSKSSRCDRGSCHCGGGKNSVFSFEKRRGKSLLTSALSFSYYPVFLKNRGGRGNSPGSCSVSR